jgi:hypothetical protein
MEQQDKDTSVASKTTLSKAELEQDLRARAWKDDAFRQEFLTNPKAVLERDYAQYFPKGKLPKELSIKMIEEEEQAICFVLPPKFSADQLAQMQNIDDETLLATAVGGGGLTDNYAVCSVISSCLGGSRCCRRDLSATEVAKNLKGIRL